MRQFLELLTTLLAFGIGLIAFKKLNDFYRLLLFQIGFYLLIDLAGLALGENNWLFNIQIPVETALLLLGAQCYFQTNKSKIVLVILFGVFLIIYFMDILFFNGFNKFGYYAVITEGFLMTLIYTALLFDHLMNRKSKTPDQALVLSGIGMLIYFACSAPYLCLMSYFQKLDPELNDRIFVYIIIPTASLRYFLIAIAFFITARKKLPA